MQNRRGFTIVEIVIVMIIMAILLGLGFAVTVNTQANARDTERSTDIKNIAQGLENRYKKGNPRATAESAYAYTAGSYPGTIEMQHMLGANVTSYGIATTTGGYISDAIPGTDTAMFSPPGVTGDYAGFMILCPAGGCVAENMTTIKSAATVTTAKYLYEPIDADNKICTGAANNPCVRFNLYWRSETEKDTSIDGTIVDTLHVVRSNHQ